MKRFVMMCVPLVLAGCVGTLRTVPPQIDADETSASDYAQSMRSGNTIVPNNMVQEIGDAFYVDPIVLDAQKTPECDLTFAPQTPASVYQFAQSVSKDCGIPVRVSADAQAALRREVQSAPDSVDVLLPPGASIPPPTPARRGFGEVQADRIELQYTGPLTGLLDAVTSRLGLSWRYRDNVVTIYHVDTRSYSIASLPSTARMDTVVTAGTTSAAGISSGGDSGGASGSSSGGLSGSSGSTQNTTVEVSFNAAEDLTKTVEAMLTRDVGRVYLSTSTQTLTVTDTPEVLDSVGRMVDMRNVFSTRQVLLNVKVLSVATDASDEFGIDWNAVYTDIARSTGVSLVRSFGGSAEATTGSINILEGSRFNGSELVFKALSKTGDVSIKTQPSVTTLNMQPAPVQIATQTSFLASSGTTQTANVGSTTSLRQETVTTGLNMTLLPHILTDGKTVLLQVSLNISTPPTIRQASSGGDTIEIPTNIDSQVFSQQVKLQSSQTLVVSGFEQAVIRSDRSGTGAIWNMLFGGGRSASKKRDVLVVLITPVVMR